MVADYRPRQLPPRYALGPILPYIAFLANEFMGQPLSLILKGILLQESPPENIIALCAAIL
jgi:hypothetical protein